MEPIFFRNFDRIKYVLVVFNHVVNEILICLRLWSSKQRRRWNFVT